MVELLKKKRKKLKTDRLALLLALVFAIISCGFDLWAGCNAPGGQPVTLTYTLNPNRTVFALNETVTISLKVDGSVFSTETLDTSSVSSALNDKSHVMTYTAGIPDAPGDCSVEFKYTIIKVDLDVDTNMDADPDNDDGQEMDMRGIIVGVNNDSDVAGAAIDNQNGTIDGATDKGELTELWLRKIPVLPSGHKVKLKVDDKSRLRIFDNTDTARIGPVAADGVEQGVSPIK
jgi:hypothetical protein